MIIAIDGPAGSGKSSTARAVARRLGFRHLDSGAFYRALTFAALRAGWPVADWTTLRSDQLDSLEIRAQPGRQGLLLYAGQEELTDSLRTPEVNAHVSQMARVPAVRSWLLHQLRAAANDSDLVADGRDMGTVVFPKAQLKIFLTADPAIRARRRLAEQGNNQPDPDTVAAETARLAGRDRMDSEREVAPLRAAEDAVPVDTTRLSFDEQVDLITGLAERLRG